ncbi:MAG: hypothetical protein GY778_19190 [bacterium]|nr:hypothetical protein [bacterium]
MAWSPNMTPVLYPPPAAVPAPAVPVIAPSQFPAWLFRRHAGQGRGKYRVFNAAEYRLYRSNVGPPALSDTPFATTPSLPHTPTDTFPDGTWYVAMRYFNGVLLSGFRPVGPDREPYLVLRIQGGQETNAPPNGPDEWRLEQTRGVVKIVATYEQDGAMRATEWAIASLVDSGPPPADAPDTTVAMAAGGLVILQHELPVALDGEVIKVRLQTRRNDGTEGTPIWVYSEASVVLSITIDRQGPSAPLNVVTWPGPMPEIS